MKMIENEMLIKDNMYINESYWNDGDEFECKAFAGSHIHPVDHVHTCEHDLYTGIIEMSSLS